MRSIAGAFDASELDESKTAHRVCIEWVIENASTPQMLKLDAAGFDAWVLEPSRNWLSTDFNIDVFHDMWVESYPELSHHFDAEKHLTAEHLAALAAAAETAATAAEDDLGAVALRLLNLERIPAMKARPVYSRNSTLESSYIKPPSRYPRSQVPGSKRGRGPGPSSKKAVIPGPRIQKSRKRGPVPGPSPSYSSKRVLGPGPSSKKAIIPGPRTQKGSGPRSQDALGYLEGGLTIVVAIQSEETFSPL